MTITELQTWLEAQGFIWMPNLAGDRMFVYRSGTGGANYAIELAFNGRAVVLEECWQTQPVENRTVEHHVFSGDKILQRVERFLLNAQPDAILRRGRISPSEDRDRQVNEIIDLLKPVSTD